MFAVVFFFSSLLLRGKSKEENTIWKSYLFFCLSKTCHKKTYVLPPWLRLPYYWYFFSLEKMISSSRCRRRQQRCCRRRCFLFVFGSLFSFLTWWWIDIMHKTTSVPVVSLPVSSTSIRSDEWMNEHGWRCDEGCHDWEWRKLRCFTMQSYFAVGFHLVVVHHQPSRQRRDRVMIQILQHY